MGVSGEPVQSSAASLVERGTTFADGYTVDNRYAVLGDLHLHEGRGPSGAVRIALWRYRGSEPLPRFIEHLESDGARLGAIRHGNLVPTVAAARQQGQIVCYWVVEEPDGISLAERLAEHPVLAPGAALHIALQVGMALAELHRAGLVHGDLDPANVHLLGPNDRVRLAWGGLAVRLEHAGMSAGRGSVRALAEVAPEVLDGRASDARTDVYGLGALLYRMLAGQAPFTVRRGGPAPGVEIGAPLFGLPAHVPPELVALLEDMLQRDPGRRPPSVVDLLDSLEDLEARNRGLPVPDGVWTPPAHPVEDGLTPPTVQRTLTPALRHDELDPALSNTPVSVQRLAPPLPPPPGPTWVPLLAASSVMALLVLGGVALLVNLTAPTLPPPPPAPAPAPVAPPAAPTPAILTLRTDPPGAEVWEAERLHGLTPLELLLTGGPADEPRALVLKLDGYAPHTVRQPWTDRPVQHSVPLQELPPPSRKKSPPRVEPRLSVREER